jgi:hypothetical protein
VSLSGSANRVADDGESGGGGGGGGVGGGLDLPLLYARDPDAWRRRPLWTADALRALAGRLFAADPAAAAAPDGPESGGAGAGELDRALMDLVTHEDARLGHAGLVLLLAHRGRRAALLEAAAAARLVARAPAARSAQRLRAEAAELRALAPWCGEDGEADPVRRAEALAGCGRVLVGWAGLLAPRASQAKTVDVPELQVQPPAELSTDLL